MANLYELTGGLLSLMDRLYDEELNEDELLKACEAIELDIEHKADGYAKILKEMGSNITAIKAEENRLKERRSTLEKRQDFLKHNLETAMRAIGKTKFKTDLFSFNIRKNPPSVVVEKPEDFVNWCQKEGRDDFLKYKEPEINKTAIKEAILIDGELIGGVEVVQGEGLQIR